MNSRIAARTLALVSALAVLGSTGAITTPAPGPAASALLSPRADATPAEHPGSTVTQANIRGSAGTMQDFLVFVITDVDFFWSGVWREDGNPEPQVTYAFPAAGEAVTTQCGRSDDLSAFYCVPDDRIVVSQSLASRVWNGTIAANEDGKVEHETGDFSVAYVVAHEFAHSLQAELGILRPDSLVYPTVKTELHADCWAGVWANDADFEGILDRGDIEEAVQTATDLGDYAIDDPLHHGTPAERSEAFLAGYDGGAAENCRTYLE